MVSFANPQTAAGSSLSEVVLPASEQFVMIARDTGRRYRIFVSRPVLEPPPGGYPVIYLLDGNATFATGAEAVRLQTRKPKGFEPALLVAIGYETDQPFDVTARYFDYTTPAAHEDLPPRKNGEPWPEVGGASAFLDFIRHELFAEIEGRFPVDPGRRTLFGHSLGGFFVLNTFLRAPDTFSTYVAGSSSVWWNKDELLDVARAFVADPPGMGGKRLLVAIGGNELEDMLEGSRTIAGILAPLSEKGLELRHAEIADEEHITVLPALLSRTVGFSLALRPGGKP